MNLWRNAKPTMMRKGKNYFESIIKKKLQGSGGLTMVEMLCAVAILILLILMAGTGIHMAVRSYYTVTMESESQLLISSITSALSDKLRFARVYGKVTGESSNKVFISGVTTFDKDIVTEDKGILYIAGQQLLPTGAYGDKVSNPNELLPDGNSNNTKFKVKKTTDSSGKELAFVTYDENTGFFTIQFTVVEEGTGLSKDAEVTVRCLNPLQIAGP